MALALNILYKDMNRLILITAVFYMDGKLNMEKWSSKKPSVKKKMDRKKFSSPFHSFSTVTIPMFNSSCINLIVTVLILQSDVTETKGPLLEFKMI